MKELEKTKELSENINKLVRDRFSGGSSEEQLQPEQPEQPSQQSQPEE